MAIGTSGYIESVHLQQAPLKPSSGLAAARMIGAVSGLVQAGANAYNTFTAPTNEELTNYRQTIDTGLNEINSLEWYDETAKAEAVSTFHNNINKDLDAKGFQFKEAMQNYLYNATKPYYDAPFEVANKLRLQQDTMAFNNDVNDQINAIVSKGMNASDTALEVAKTITGIEESLTPSEKVEYGPALQKLVTQYASQAAQAEGNIKEANASAKVLFGYTNKVDAFNNSLTASNDTASSKAIKYNDFKNKLLLEAEKNNPEIYASLQKELNRQGQLYNAGAAKEQQTADRNIVISTAVRQWTNGETTLKDIDAIFSGMSDKAAAQTDLLTSFKGIYARDLANAIATKDPGIYKATEARLNSFLNDLNNSIYFGQNNSPDASKQYQLFTSQLAATKSGIQATFENSLYTDAISAINTGNIKEAGVVAGKLQEAGFAVKANTVIGKITQTTKLANEMTGIIGSGTFDINKPTNSYAGATKEAKERITQVMTQTVGGFMTALSQPVTADQRKEIVDQFNTFLANKGSELKGVRDQFSAQVIGAQSQQELTPFMNLIDDVGGHNAAMLIGEDNVKEINMITSLLPVMPNLEPGKEVSDLRSRLSAAEVQTMEGKVLGSYKDIADKASEIPVPEARQSFLDAAKLIYKATDIKTAESVVQNLFEKSKSSYLEVGNGYVVGVPGAAFKNPAYYERAVDMVSSQFPDVTTDEITENYNLHHMPSGDVALVPKTGYGNVSQSLVVEKAEIIDNLTKNYDGSAEQYAALFDAYRGQEIPEGQPHPADVIHKGWLKLNAGSVSVQFDVLTDNVANSVAGDILNVASDYTVKSAQSIANMVEMDTNAVKNLWDIFSEETSTYFSEQAAQGVSNVNRILFGGEGE